MRAMRMRTGEVKLEGLHEGGGAAVMKEEETLTESPERRRAELVCTRGALVNAICETGAHVVQGEVGVGMIGNARHAGERRRRCREIHGVARRAADTDKQVRSIPG